MQLTSLLETVVSLGMQRESDHTICIGFFLTWYSAHFRFIGLALNNLFIMYVSCGDTSFLLDESLTRNLRRQGSPCQRRSDLHQHRHSV